MGSQAALVRRQRRNLRALLSRRGAMARRGGKSTAPESHGAGHDVFHATQFLLLRRRVRWLLARMDLDEYCSRSSPPQESCWATQQRRGCGLLEARASTHGNVSAVARLARSERCNAVLLRLAGAS